MSFYGKIINYVTNAFTNIRSDKKDDKNETISVSTGLGNSIKFTGDGTINSEVGLENGEIVVQYSHVSIPSDATITNAIIESKDENNIITTSLGIELPTMDSYGHLNIIAKDNEGKNLPNRIFLLAFEDDGKGNIKILGGQT